MYHDLDAQTRSALQMPSEALRAGLGARAEIFADNEAMISALADHILGDYRAALKAGRDRVGMIVPVGPVGQYPLVVRRAQEQGISLDRLTLFVMDEYLTDDGAWISEDDPLSFRAHMRRNLLDHLPEELRPEVVVPNPGDPAAVGRRIAEIGGLDVSYAGVGITGHLAFNEPMPGCENAAYFADLPTRVVPLLPETRLINSVTAARGNVARIPRMAVTVGMREILQAKRLRIFMNRHWQCAAIRRLAFGPVTAGFPASLAQTHDNWSLHLVEEVLEAPEPVLA
ncbi:hypothetical protein PGB28_05760 [Primorskyibacter aestuariivivens]|uniref:hypothetical protein n=1 Tax=Primorskyibacter aestuariivivens TaxID=1888912 RepID=UPI002300F630|nr:hypothetical protein [Primorskyibacter aestuariivivens]MDA7427955.1 hypothetical protein [Primorskyibacter aestuariivivens]